MNPVFSSLSLKMEELLKYINERDVTDLSFVTPLPPPPFFTHTHTYTS